MTPQKIFEELAISLPPAPKPAGVYTPALIVDDRWLYVSGHGPCLEDGSLMKGRIGVDLDADEGKMAARQVGLTILSTLIAQLGSLDRVKRVVKTLGMVNATPSFEKHPYVINGCSELFAQLWGEQHGVGARSAVGMGSLPDNIPVEIEVLFELH